MVANFGPTWMAGPMGTPFRPWAIRGQRKGFTRRAEASSQVRPEERGTVRLKEKLDHSIHLPLLFLANTWGHQSGD